MRKRTIVLILALTPSVLLLTSFTHAQLNSTLQVSFIDAGQRDNVIPPRVWVTRISEEGRTLTRAIQARIPTGGGI